MPKTDVSEKFIKMSLSNDDAEERLKRFGKNIVFEKTRLRPIVAFIMKFKNPLLLILIFASIGSFLIGEHINATILLLMIFVSVLLDFINSYRSEKAVNELVTKVIVKASVVRNGKIVELEFKNIVPGDIVYLTPGDVVPADCQILESIDFFVNQSVLTGESFPVLKKVTTKEIDSHILKTEFQDIVFMGTSVTTGSATVKVLKTGRETEFGKIAQTLTKSAPETDFEKNIRKFSIFITKLTLVMVSFVFLANALLGHGLLTSFIFSVAIAVGLTPELLPVIISVSLSHGSLKMAEKKVIVKNLSSIQNFGSMNILCMDKTGTLTKDEIELSKYVDAEGNISDEVLLFAYLNSYYHAGVQNPLDTAIRKHGHFGLSGYTKVEEVPFDFERRRQSVVVEKDNIRFLITKGAPEDIFKVCESFRTKHADQKINDSIKSEMMGEFKKLSGEGYRVLGIAIKEVEKKDNYTRAEEKGMIFLGFLTFSDPPKETAAEAVKDFKNLGIELKIVTGDNEILTQKICQEIGLEVKGIVLGDQIDRMTDSELALIARKTTIFARINPEQKEKLILSLKKANQVVGFLGDGINDAPALKAADVGISVNNAVDVAKDTADVILLEKRLGVLKDGVLEGRKTFHNTMKYILMGFSSNFGNMFSMMGASVILPFLPMLPSQVLLNNFLYDTSQLSLPTDEVDSDDIKKPTFWSLPFIRRYVLIIGPISSIFDFLTFGVLLLVFHFGEKQFQTGWFMESIATQVFVIYVIRTKKIPFFQSKPSRALLINTLLAVGIAWIIPYLFIGKYFEFAALPLPVLLIILVMVFIYLLLVQFVKRWFYKKFSNI